MGSKTLDLRGSDHDFLLIETSLKLFSVCRPPSSVETFSHDFGNNDDVMLNLSIVFPQAFRG